MKVEIKQEGIKQLKKQLSKQLFNACEYGSITLQDYTPVDTKRLFTTTRADNLEVYQNSIVCEIVAGGQRSKGVIKEQELDRDVNYAIFVESRTSYITNNLSSIANTVIKNL